MKFVKLSISVAEMQTAQELANVLMEMLDALDPNNREVILLDLKFFEHIIPLLYFCSVNIVGR